MGKGFRLSAFMLLYFMANPNLSADNNPAGTPDKEFENSIRPSAIQDFSGQPQLIENLLIFIKAAKQRGEALDHILFHGLRVLEKLP